MDSGQLRDCGCGTSVLHVDDNVELDDFDDNDTQPSVSAQLDTDSSSSSGSGGSSTNSKQRYIAMMQCSEHVHNRSHTLLPPPLLLPLMMCAQLWSWPSTAVSTATLRLLSHSHRWQHRFSAVGLIRINNTLFEASYICGCKELGTRLSIAYQHRIVERTKTQNNKRRLRGDNTAERPKGRYTVTARSGDEAWCVGVHNVCYGCGCGLPASRSEGKCAECEELDLGH